VVRNIANCIAVMYFGRIVEFAKPDALYERPPIKLLLRSIPIRNQRWKPSVTLLVPPFACLKRDKL